MERIVRIVLVGDTGVGKTALLRSYADNVYTPTHVTTMGVDFRHVRIRVGKDVVKLQLWDTAGHERYRSITNTYYRGAHLILLVYDVTNSVSFQGLGDWIQTIDESSDAAIVIVGNKVDDSHRQVTRQDAAAFAERMDCAYVEASAKTALNLTEVFERFVGSVGNAGSAGSDPAIQIAKEVPQSKTFWDLC
jgi:small GTP-binding protein